MSDEKNAMKMFEEIGKMFDELIIPGCDSLGWDQLKKMQFMFAPIHDNIAGGHWIWDDTTAKA